MPTITIKIPLNEPTQIKKIMYENMQKEFSTLCNKVVELNDADPKFTKTNIDHALKTLASLPTTLQQEARKLALSRHIDYNKSLKTKKPKGKPSFRCRVAISFNNQN